MLLCTLSQQCILSHPAVPKGVLTICTRWEAGKEGRGETNWQRGRGRERLDAFSTLLHFSLAPRGFSKAFSKKQAAVWWIKQQRQPLPSLPSRLLALIFQSLSVPALCLFYALPGKWIFSSGPLPSPHSPSITHLLLHPPHLPPPAVPCLCLQFVPGFPLPRLTCGKACCVLRFGPG